MVSQSVMRLVDRGGTRSIVRMRISRIDIFRLSLPFTIPVKVGGMVRHNREGFLIALADDQGRCGYGEIAPLPGFDFTSLKRCFQDIPTVGDSLNSTDLSYDRFDIAAPLLGIADVPVSSWTGHTLFGVESALLSLSLQQPGKGDRAALFPLPDGPLRIPVNALFIPEPAADTLEQQLRDLKNCGATTFKIKIGRLPAEEEIPQIRRLVEEMGLEISLRLDGNGNLTPAAYRRYFEALGDLPVEYVEEPLPAEDMERAGDVPWPLALDESLAQLLDPEEPCLSRLAPTIRTVILKPGLVNGLHAMARAVRNARQAGIGTIFSSAFNSGITLATLGVFSRLLGLPPETAHGLDTLRYLAADVLRPSPEISRGMLEIPAALIFGRASFNAPAIRGKVL